VVSICATYLRIQQGHWLRNDADGMNAFLYGFGMQQESSVTRGDIGCVVE
jgi:hypothetical protein